MPCVLTMSRPSVSVVIPHYDQAFFLQHALNSIAKAADNYPGHVELILVDDGTPEPFDVEAPARMIFDRHAVNQGTAAAINTGMEIASGAYLTWASADNLMHPDWLRMLGHHLDMGAGVAYGSYWYWPVGRERMTRIAGDFDSGVASWWDARKDEAPHSNLHFTPYARDRQINQEACFLGPAHLIRRSVWCEHSGAISHDLAAFLRVEEACWMEGLPIVGIGAPLALYFAHPERAGIRLRDQYDAPQVLAEARARRKELGL